MYVIWPIHIFLIIFKKTVHTLTRVIVNVEIGVESANRQNLTFHAFGVRKKYVLGKLDT